MESSAPSPVPSPEQVPAAPQYAAAPAYTPMPVVPVPAPVPLAPQFGVPDAVGNVTITPLKSTYWKRTALAGGILVLWLASRAVLLQSPVYWIAVLITLALAAGITALYLARARVVITPDRVGKRGLFGFRWTDRATLDRLLVARGYGAAMQISSARTDAFLFTKKGKRVMRLTGQVWDEPRVQAFHAALALPTRVRQAPTTVKDLRREEPKALNWNEAYPWASFAATFVIVIVVLVAALVVGGLLTMQG